MALTDRFEKRVKPAGNPLGNLAGQASITASAGSLEEFAIAWSPLPKLFWGVSAWFQ